MSARAAAALLAALGLAVSSPPARAQDVSAACRPLVDAMKKQLTTPHHAYMETGTPGSSAKPRTSELIGTADAMYVLVSGKWMKSPMGPTEALAQMQENFKTAKAYSCERVGPELVGGVPTEVYTSHSDNQGVIADARTWVAKSTGLPVRQQEDVAVDPTTRQHISVRWEYGNVRAPAVGSAP